MILELATIDIKPGTASAFEADLAKAQGVLSRAEGYLSHEFQQCVENPDRYILLIKWQTLEAHTKGFRESTLFHEWRDLIGSYFVVPPYVQHFKLKIKS